MENQWYWKNKDFFEAFDAQKEKFLRVSQKMEIDKNTMIFFEEDLGDCCFYLSKGLVRIFSVSDSGKEPIFSCAGRGICSDCRKFWEMCRVRRTHRL